MISSQTYTLHIFFPMSIYWNIFFLDSLSVKFCLFSCVDSFKWYSCPKFKPWFTHSKILLKKKKWGPRHGSSCMLIIPHLRGWGQPTAIHVEIAWFTTQPCLQKKEKEGDGRFENSYMWEIYRQYYQETKVHLKLHHHSGSTCHRANVCDYTVLYLLRMYLFFTMVTSKV